MSSVFSCSSLFSLAFSCLTSSASFADVPREVAYQGFLANAVGEPVHCPDADACPDMSFNLVFRLYDAAADGDAFWEETHNNVFIKNGHFQVVLGSATALEPSVFTTDAFLGIELNEQGEMAPRQKLLSSVLTLKAEEADLFELNML